MKALISILCYFLMCSLSAQEAIRLGAQVMMGSDRLTVFTPDNQEERLTDLHMEAGPVAQFEVLPRFWLEAGGAFFHREIQGENVRFALPGVVHNPDSTLPLGDFVSRVNAFRFQLLASYEWTLIPEGRLSLFISGGIGSIVGRRVSSRISIDGQGTSEFNSRATGGSLLEAVSALGLSTSLGKRWHLMLRPLIAFQVPNDSGQTWLQSERISLQVSYCIRE
jgi:hypothetical protein